MASYALSAPEPEATAQMMADWLELRSFSSSDRRSLVQELVGQQDMDEDQDTVDISEEDIHLEDIAAIVTEEIARRQAILKDAYPFSVNEAGDTLEMNSEWGVGGTVYLFSLILSHSPHSSLVSAKLAPTVRQLTIARDLFQICATLGASGFCRGPAYSFGWPRLDGSGFLEKLKVIWIHFSDGKPRSEPLEQSPSAVKDEGIDVISWTPQRDGNPGTIYLLGQAASGANWKVKSVRDSVRLFHEEWFEVVPSSDVTAMMLIPFFIESSRDWRRFTRTHGIIIDRGRLPSLAALAATLPALGLGPIEGLDEVGNISAWILSHRTKMLAMIAG